MEFSGFEDANISGGHCGGVTPVPISNTAVKPARADGTWRGTSWESRSPPDYSNDEARLSAITALGGLCRVSARYRARPMPRRPRKDSEAQAELRRIAGARGPRAVATLQQAADAFAAGRERDALRTLRPL